MRLRHRLHQRHILSSLISVLLLCLATASGWCMPRGGTTTAETVLIVYDSKSGTSTAPDAVLEDVSLADALQLQQLLGHFPLPADLVPLNAYQSGQLKRYQHAFFIGNQKTLVVPPTAWA